MEAIALQQTADNRCNTRTNLFALGTLCVGGIRQTVRIRNLSDVGALVDGSDLPHPGSTVTLSRNETHANGSVVWTRERQAGLRFDQSISIEEWLPRLSAGQNRVDNIVCSVRAGGGPVEANSENALPDPELLAKSLDRLADALASDKVVIARHAYGLQTLDIVSQGLRQLARRG